MESVAVKRPRMGAFPWPKRVGNFLSRDASCRPSPSGETELWREFTHASTAIVETVWSVSLAAEGLRPHPRLIVDAVPRGARARLVADHGYRRGGSEV